MEINPQHTAQVFWKELLCIGGPAPAHQNLTSKISLTPSTLPFRKIRKTPKETLKNILLKRSPPKHHIYLQVVYVVYVSHFCFIQIDFLESLSQIS